MISLVMLNYNVLQSEMTPDYNERTALSSARIFFSTISSIISALLPMEIVKRSADVQQGYILMGLVFGAFFALPFVATVWTAKQRPKSSGPTAPIKPAGRPRRATVSM